MSRGEGAIRVSLETGSRLTFASALDWPGWSRSGRGDEAAVETLRAYAPRYAPVAVEAGLEPPTRRGSRSWSGSPARGRPTSGFPAPSGRWTASRSTGPRRRGWCAILEAGWAFFDRVVAGAPPILRKGPRGGGRDRDAIVDHVVGAEVEAYARKLGIRLPRPAWDDLGARATEREAIAAALRAAGAALQPRSEPARGRTGAGHRATPHGGSAGTCSTTPGRSRTGASEALAAGVACTGGSPVSEPGPAAGGPRRCAQLASR